MIQGHQLDSLHNAATVTTFAGTSATVLFWGLHVSDIAVIMSAMASVCGVGLQFYLAIRRIRRLERAEVANVKVTSAMAESHRALNQKVETHDEQASELRSHSDDG